MNYSNHLSNNQIEMLPCMAAFAVVVDCGSFVEASSRLGITPSAVSKQVSKLESSLSLKLLERSTRQLRVNSEGSQVYSHCKALLESSAHIFRLKDGLLDAPQGMIRIAATRSLYRSLNKLIPEILINHKNLKVQLVTDESPTDFISKGIDIGIFVTESPPLGLVARKLGAIDYIACATPSYLERFGYPKHPSDLPEHNCLSYLEDTDNQVWKFSSPDESYNCRITGIYFIDSPESLLEATTCGLGISCLPSKIIRDHLNNGSLVTVLPDWRYSGSLQGTVWLLYQPSRPTPKRLQVTVEHIISAFDKSQLRSF